MLINSTCWQCYTGMIGDVAFGCNGVGPMNFCLGDHG